MIAEENRNEKIQLAKSRTRLPADRYAMLCVNCELEMCLCLSVVVSRIPALVSVQVYGYLACMLLMAMAGGGALKVPMKCAQADHHNHECSNARRHIDSNHLDANALFTNNSVHACCALARAQKQAHIYGGALARSASASACNRSLLRRRFSRAAVTWKQHEATHALARFRW